MKVLRLASLFVLFGSVCMMFANPNITEKKGEDGRQLHSFKRCFFPFSFFGYYGYSVCFTIPHGFLDFLELPEEVPATVTTPEPAPTECSEYNILNSPSRSKDFINDGGNYKCDFVTEGYEKSSDWQGSGWYRFVSPAGTQVVKGSLAEYSCGTVDPITLSSGSIPAIFETSNLIFSYLEYDGNDVVSRDLKGKVTNCGMHFVYFLLEPQAAPNNCQAYCSM